MDFDQVRETIKEISFEELRLDCDNNFEAVVVKDEIEKLKKRLENFFGLPAYPSKNRLSGPVSQTIDAFGGIMPGQTLYYWSRGADTVFAMLWPWKDGRRTTLKIIKKL